MLALAESERCDVVRFVAPAVTRAQPASALVGSLCVQRAASGTCRGGLLSYLISARHARDRATDVKLLRPPSQATAQASLELHRRLTLLSDRGITVAARARHDGRVASGRRGCCHPAPPMPPTAHMQTAAGGPLSYLVKKHDLSVSFKVSTQNWFVPFLFDRFAG